MDLQKIIPDRFIRYQWQQPEGSPYDPATSCPFPGSRHAWGSIGSVLDQVPDGNAVAAVPLQPDGTRGVLTLWADWFKGIGGTNNFIQIALLDSAGPDAIPPLFDMIAPNCKAGRMVVTVGAGDSIGFVAGAIAGLFGAMLGISGLDTRFAKLGGRVIPDFVRADLGNGTVAILSPAPWRPTSLQQLSGAWGDVDPDAFEEHQGTYRPAFLAGVRPAPWLVVGNAWAGRGEDHSIIG